MGANVGRTMGNVGRTSGNLGRMTGNMGGREGTRGGWEGTKGGREGTRGGREGTRGGCQGTRGGWEADGRMSRRADGRTAADGGGQANKRTGADGWTGGGWEADGWTGGMADGRNGGRAERGGRCRTDFPRGKTLQLMHQLTWPLEIQRGRPRVTVKLPHLPTPSR